MAFEIIFSFIFHFIFLPFLILLPFSYDLSAKFRYYFKFFVFYTLMSVCGVVLLPFLLWKLVRGGKIPTCKISCFVTRVLNIRWNIVGLENLKLHKPCVIIANQQNSIDVIGILKIWSHLDEDCVIIIDNRIFSNPFTLLWSTRDVFYEEEVKHLIRQHVNIWIFPKKIHELKSGIFHLLLKEHLPVVPMMISDYYFINPQNKIFDPGYVTIEILQPISIARHSVDDVLTLVQEIESTMTHAFVSLSKKVTPPTLAELRSFYVS